MTNDELGFLNVVLIADHDRIVAEKDARIERLREALTEIREKGMKSVPCPDGRKGCAVAHFVQSDEGYIARKALEADGKET